MASFGLIEEGLPLWLTEQLSDLAQPSAGGRMVSILEGSYDRYALGRNACVHNSRHWVES
ncbi:MAG TPA: hypothetical protein VFC95_00250 [Guyparkeria sp.]|nr:hypothetical protein [Guyparkeria sp.]